MARRRHYRGLVRFPGLAGLKLPASVKPTDVLVGIGLGLAVSIGLKKAAEMSGLALPSIASNPLVGGAASAAVLYFAQKKKAPARAGGHAVGALLGGAAVLAYGELQSRGMLGDMRTLPPGYGAPLFDNPRLQSYGGAIFDNPNVNLARINAMQGMGDENEDGMFPAP